MKIKLLIAVIAVLGMTGSAFAQVTNLGVISIDNTTNEYSATQLLAGSTHLVSIRYDLSNCSPSINYWVGSNGYEIYSPDGADWVYLQGLTGPLVETARTRHTDPFPTQLSRFRKHFEAANRLSTVPADWVETPNYGFDPAGGSQGASSAAGYYLATLSVPVPGESVIGGYLTGENDIAVTLEFQTLAADHGLTMCVDSNTVIVAWEWACAGVPDDYAQWDNGLGASEPRCWEIYDPVQSVISSGTGNLPTEFDLNQNYPNPFNPVTTIKFDLPHKAHTTLNVFNVLGQKVTTLVDETLAPERYTVEWDGTTDAGAQVASGIYFYRLTADERVMTKKMMLLK